MKPTHTMPTPPNPAFSSAIRYSDSYIPKRHGPHHPDVKKT